MTSGAPWSVKGINPRAREIAKDLARKDGMTLGEWINRLILEDEAAPAALNEPAAGPSVIETPRRAAEAPVRFEAVGHPADEVGRVASALDALSERIEAAERRQTGALAGIDESVRGALQRLELADREQVAVAARFEGLADEIKTDQARAAERVRRLEQDAAGPRSAEALQALEGAMGKLAERLYEDEARTRDALAELRARVDQPASDPIDPASLVEAVVSRVGERLEAAQTRTGEALRDLGGSFVALDRRLKSVEAGAGPDLEQRFARLSADLSLKMEASRLEMAAKLRDAADGRFDRMEGKLTEMAGYVQAAEQRSAQAMEKMGREVVGLADSLNRRIQGAETRGAAAMEQAGGEISRVAAVMEQRLGRADTVQAQALEKLGGEIARITERLAERIANAERRNALAIDDVGEQVARVTERLNQRHERGSADLAERIRQSEERTARLLEDAREKIDASLRRVAEPVAPTPAAPPPEAAPAEKPPAFGGLFGKPAPQPLTAQAPEPEADADADADAEFPAAPFGAAAFPSADPGNFAQADFETADIDAAEAFNDFDIDAALEPEDEIQGAFDVDPFAPPAAAAVADLAPEPEADLAPETVAEAFTPPPVLTTREVIEQARAAARAASQPENRNRRMRLDAEEPRPAAAGRGGLFGAFGMRGKKRAGSTLSTMLIFMGATAALSAGVAAYYLGVAETKGPPAPRVLEARAAQATAVKEIATGEADSTPGAAPAPVAAPTPLAEPAAGAPAAAPGESALTLYTEGVRRIEAKDSTGIDTLRRAANLGYAPAQFYLAKLYENGDAGLKKNIAEARRWTERAAQAGDRRAMHNLGLYYFEGAGGAKNSTTAAQWFRRAADLGLADSQYNLARLYEEGLGVGQNGAEAYKWYLIAAKNGDGESQKSAARVKPQLSAEAQTAAQRSAAGFKPATANPSQSVLASAAAAVGSAGVSTAQKALSKLGYYQGPQDGVMSPALKMAVAAYQRDQGVTSTGALDADILNRLQTFAR
jgi:localization factor PodJL